MRYAWIVLSCLILSEQVHFSSSGIIIYIPSRNIPSRNILSRNILSRNRVIRSMRLLLRIGRFMRRINTARRIISACNTRIFCETSSLVTRDPPNGNLRITVSLSNPIFCRAQHRNCPDRGFPMLHATTNMFGGIS
ncbi:uncharacterized protein [Parasteatoda tepidariorum]|uniref:uncharacterized protein n=1 Tax=Parasteatoda tepidariorum TaxID=114398 RepID=UPI0039BC8001